MPITKPNEQRVRRRDEFSWQHFAEDCLHNKYILVVGSEAILNRTYNSDAQGNSMSLLLQLAKDQLVNNLGDYVDAELERSRLGNCDNFNVLSKIYPKDKVKKSVLDVVRDTDFRQLFDDEIEPSLMQLLRTRCFRIVITTAVDPYLEIAMEKVWGKGGYDVLHSIEDAQNKFRHVSCDEFGVSRPVLCYVFGKVDSTKPHERFVLTENDAMYKISAWFERAMSNEFLKKVKTFQLLSVGSQFDDWMFRFFWFLLRGEVNDDNRKQQVAVEIKSNDSSLANYLESEQVKLFPDARDFMSRAVSQIDECSRFDALPRSDNGVFISYAHEDRYIALPLFTRLVDAGLNVWLDEDKLNGGAEYETRIRNAINNCHVFVPILSSQVKSDLLNRNIPNRWYPQEWQWAQCRWDDVKKLNPNGDAGFTVVPVVVGDYRFSESYHQYLPPCIVKTTAYETSKNRSEDLVEIISRNNSNTERYE